jgi:regulation of enolase protein 1 (concanavalin A-like superfamily)
MTRKYLGWALLGLTFSVVAVAQDRKPVVLKGWGEVFDPDADCKVDLEGEKLTMTVPKTWHALDAESNKINAPVVLRDVEGDFVAEVTIDGDFKPTQPSSNPRSAPFNGAGILLWSDARNYLRLERAAILRNGSVFSYSLFEERKNAMPQPPGGGIVLPNEPLHLRMERKGDQFLASVSTDGKNWRAFPPRTVKLPAKLKLGLAASSSSAQPFTAKMEDFRVLRPAQ